MLLRCSSERKIIFLTLRRGTVTIDQLAVDSRLRGPRRLAWPRTSPFHGGNTGSNPVGDAKPVFKPNLSASI
jgi:hypothetical protein